MKGRRVQSLGDSCYRDRHQDDPIIPNIPTLTLVYIPGNRKGDICQPICIYPWQSRTTLNSHITNNTTQAYIKSHPKQLTMSQDPQEASIVSLEGWEHGNDRTVRGKN